MMMRKELHNKIMTKKRLMNMRMKMMRKKKLKNKNK
jgi:hypothetical protein